MLKILRLTKCIILSGIILISALQICFAQYVPGDLEVPESKSVVYIERYRVDHLNYDHVTLVKKIYAHVADNATLLYTTTQISTPDTGEYYEYDIIYHYSGGTVYVIEDDTE